MVGTRGKFDLGGPFGYVPDGGGGGNCLGDCCGVAILKHL